MPEKKALTSDRAVIETFGAVLPDIMIEAIVDPDNASRLVLETWDGRKSRIASKVLRQGVTYVAGPIGRGLMRGAHFPTATEAFGSSENLISSMREFLFKYSRVWPDAAALLIAFSLASWFPDCIPVAPVLYLQGPGNAVRVVLRLLACLCRRSILLADLDMPALATLPHEVGATLLIDQRKLGRRITRTLSASNDRHFQVARGNGWLDVRGAKAFSCDGRHLREFGLSVSLLPQQDSLPVLTDQEELVAARSFQSRLLRYRMIYYAQVRNSKVVCGPFVPAMRDEARAWLAPICDCPDLIKSVSEALFQQSQEVAGARFSDPKCVALESALFFCHKEDTKDFFVGEAARTANTLLMGRHEDSELSEKKMGLLLRDLGLYGERVTRGYKIALTDAVRERIHEVARAYQVLPVQNGVNRCRHCSKKNAT